MKVVANFCKSWVESCWITEMQANHIWPPIKGLYDFDIIFFIFLFKYFLLFKKINKDKKNKLIKKFCWNFVI